MYKLLKVDGNILNSIMNDVKDFNAYFRELAYLISSNTPPEYYVLDERSGNYLLRLPQTTREVKVRYVFKMKGSIILAYRKGDLSQDIYIDNQKAVERSEWSKVKSEIVEAMNVYGVFGRGVYDSEGNLAYVLNAG